MLLVLLAALLLAQSHRDVCSSSVRGTKEGWFSRVLHYMESNPETLEELLSRKYAVLEGDILLPSDRNAVHSRWLSPDVPYIISPALADRTDDIIAAMEMVSQNTCVTFHQRTTETNYLQFVHSTGCASYVGFIGGEQPVFVGPLCIVGNIVHELLHALGFHHEHTRPDREQYITVLPHNIMDGMERNFKKQEGELFSLPYDISSIMHYGSRVFSLNGLPTIISKLDVKDMGQREKMTTKDNERVRLLYACDKPNKLKEQEVGGDDEEKKKEGSDMYVLLHDKKRTVTAATSGGAATRGRSDTTETPGPHGYE